MTPIALQELILKRLIRRAGGSQRRWRAVIGPILVHDVTTHAHCNWSIKPAGTTGEIAEVERLLDQLRVEHPFVTPG